MKILMKFRTAEICESEKLLNYIKSICNYLKMNTKTYARPIPVLQIKLPYQYSKIT